MDSKFFLTLNDQRTQRLYNQYKNKEANIYSLVMLVTRVFVLIVSYFSLKEVTKKNLLIHIGINLIHFLSWILAYKYPRIFQKFHAASIIVVRPILYIFTDNFYYTLED